MTLSLLKSKNKIFYGWVVVIDLHLILATILGTRYSFGIFLESIEAEFVLNRALTSSIFSVYMVICAAAAALGGLALDRYGPKAVYIIMGVFTGLSLVLTSQTNVPWQLFVTYSLLLAIGTGAGFTVAIATVSRWFTRKRGLALGITLSGEGLGMLAVAPAAVYLLSRFGWRLTFVVMGLAAGLLIVALSLLLRKNPGEMGLPPDGIETPGKNEPASPSNLRLSEATRTTNFWFYGLMWLLFAVSMHLVLTHVVAYATDTGISPTKAATIISLIGGTSILGRLVIGPVSDRIGRKLTAILCALLMVAGIVLVACYRDLWIFYVFAVMFGLTLGGFSTPIAALIGELFGLANIGAITGTLVVGFCLGAAIGPYIGGVIFDVTHSYFIAFLTAALTMLLSVVFLALLKPQALRKVIVDNKRTEVVKT